MRAIRMLMMVPALAVLAACSDDDPVAPPEPNLVEVAQSVNAQSGEFSTLIAALVAADRVGALSTPEQRTVFAPTDAAFAAMGLNAANIGTVPVEDLTGILLYHVTPGRLPAAQVVARSSLPMANGGTTQLRVEGTTAYIDGARIVTTDVEASNGIIHIIDAVLQP